MPAFCKGCGRRRVGLVCKKVCREAVDNGVVRGDLGVERIPPLDGILFINDDGTDYTQEEKQRKRQAIFPDRVHLRRTYCLRPPGWKRALQRIAARSAVRLRNGVSIPEC